MFIVVNPNIRVWKVVNGWTELGWRQEVGCEGLDERVKILFINRACRFTGEDLRGGPDQISSRSMWMRARWAEAEQVCKDQETEATPTQAKPKGWGVEGASTGTKSNQEAKFLTKRFFSFEIRIFHMSSGERIQICTFMHIIVRTCPHKHSQNLERTRGEVKQRECKHHK